MFKRSGFQIAFVAFLIAGLYSFCTWGLPAMQGFFNYKVQELTRATARQNVIATISVYYHDGVLIMTKDQPTSKIAYSVEASAAKVESCQGKLNKRATCKGVPVGSTLNILDFNLLLVDGASAVIPVYPNQISQ